MKRLWSLICKPLPAWLTLALIAGGVGSATTYPFWSSGSAQFGPLGTIDLGATDTTANIASPDPGIFNSGGSNLAFFVPYNSGAGALDVISCLTNGCSSGNQQTTMTVTTTAVKAIVPVFGAYPTTNPTTAPFGPCYDYSGAACPSTWHVIKWNATISCGGTIGPGVLCPSPGPTGTAVPYPWFTPLDVSCSGNSSVQGMVVQAYAPAANAIDVQLVNATATTQPNNAMNATIVCQGP